MAKTIVAMVAHPDDESFSMGGTLAARVREGYQVIIYALSDGLGARGDPMSSVIARRAAHFSKACQILGAQGHLVRLFDDQASDARPQLALNRDVATLIQGQPAAIFTHDPCDLNLDHRRVAEAVLVASRGRCPVWSAAPEWPVKSLWPFHPRRYVDIVVATKLAACACYEDELREAPHPRSLAVIGQRGFEGFVVR